MRLKTLTIVIATVGCFNHLSSQHLVNPPQVVPSSPEATNLIRNIEYPVSYGHGRADITIPIWEITVGEVTIPISISYDHKGLRPFEFTDYLGQGWTLNAEPSISRKANGKPDKDCLYYTTRAEDRDDPYLWRLTNSELPDDESPDEYFYRISAKSGGFIFKPSTRTNISIAPIPYEPIDVAYNVNTSTFTITDDDGSVYKFGSKERSRRMNPYQAEPVTTSWKCDEISTNKGKVSFQYYDEDKTITNITEILIIEDEYPIWSHLGGYSLEALPVYMRFKETRFYTKYRLHREYYEGPRGETITHYNFISNPVDSDYLHDVYKTQEYRTNNKRIAGISFPNGSIVFDTDENGALKTIKVYSGSSIVKTITFNHELITSPSNDAINYPVLNSVELSGGGTDEKYEFDYYGVFPLPMHHDLVHNINFWGHWTGGDRYPRTDNHYVHSSHVSVNYKDTPSIPKSAYFYIGSGDRMGKTYDNGILKSISTNSGSVIEFEYESDRFTHTYVDGFSGVETSKMKETGGLRIKTIKQYDHTGAPPVERHFKYGESENGLGRARFNIESDHYTTTQRILDEHYNIVDEKRRRTLSASLLGDVTFSGVPIFYDHVTEYTKGYVNGVLKDFGKTVYHYNYPERWVGGPAGPAAPPDIRMDDKRSSWQYGQLKSERQYKYDETRNSFEEIRSTEYFHTTFLKEFIPSGRAEISTIRSKVDGGPQPISPYGFSFYTHNIVTGASRIGNKINTYYTPTGNIVETMVYTYGNPDHLYPTAVTTTRSDGSTHTQTFKYPQDAGSINDQEHRNAISWMLDKNVLRPVLEQTESFGSSNTLPRTSYYYYKYYPSSQWPLQHKTVTKDGNNASEQRIICHNYDRYGNPLYVTKDDATDIVYLWGHNGQYLSAVIENATYDDVKTALNVSSLEGFLITNNYESAVSKLRQSPALENAHITAFKYKPLVGIVQVIDPRGISTFYNYDVYGRLKDVSDHQNNKMNEYIYHIRNNR